MMKVINTMSFPIATASRIAEMIRIVGVEPGHQRTQLGILVRTRYFSRYKTVDFRERKFWIRFHNKMKMREPPFLKLDDLNCVRQISKMLPEIAIQDQRFLMKNSTYNSRYV